MSPSQEQVAAGHAVYTPQMLRLYDLIVLGVSNRWVWKCPTSRLLKLYNDNVSGNHLDVGVGTGYYLDHCQFPGEQPRVTLLDLNTNCLEAAARRIQRYQPTRHQANIFESLDLASTFDSIGVNYVLHCLPGSMSDKFQTITNLACMLTHNGVLFGSTLLHDGVPRGWLARRLMAFYNRKQVFSNEQDNLQSLDEGLAARFESYEIEVVGCAALFKASHARSPLPA